MVDQHQILKREDVVGVTLKYKILILALIEHLRFCKFYKVKMKN